MSTGTRGLRPAAAGVLMGVVFLSSVGVATAATLSWANGNSGETASAQGSTASSSSPNAPGTQSGPSSSPSADPYGSSQRQVAPVTSAPKKASRDAVKKSRSAFCKAKASSLPEINFRSENLKWGKVFETIAADRGYKPGAIDGIYTVQTRNAVRQLQSEFGLTDNGELGRAEWRALWDELCAPEPVYVPPSEPAYVPPSEPAYTGPSDGGGGPTDSGGGLDRID